MSSLTKNSLADHSQYPADAWALLSPQLTPTRRERMLATAARRTNHIRLVVQDVHQPHNISACIRSAEGFGIQNIDVVTLKTKFSASTVARGVDHWVDIHRYDSVPECSTALRKSGYIVAAAFPYGNATVLDELPVNRPLALVFGNEHEGLDHKWKENSDILFTIPMSGIVESLNISVCAAVSMYSVTQRAKKDMSPEQYYLSQSRQQQLLNQWICRQIPTWPEQLRRLRDAPNLK
jgi:tRNA (guanosine-2'-O-)-methyltransferase